MEILSLSKAPLFCNPLHRRRSTTPAAFRRSKRPPVTVGLASKGGDDSHGHNSDGGGRLVDENMVVLRKRIHEVRVAESSSATNSAAADEPPADWMEWEKRYHRVDYGADVCQVVGLLQLALMNTRPSLAIGSIAVVALSLPASIALLFFHVIQWTSHS